jgi:hypothetical protein
MRPVVRPKFSRDMELFDARVKGKSFDEVANDFGIAVRKTKEIFKRVRNYNNEGRLGFAFRSAVYFELHNRLGVTSLIDLKNFIEGEPGWRGVLAKKCGFDKETIAEIEGFAKENGIIVHRLSKTDEKQIKDAVRSFAKEKGITDKEAFALFAKIVTTALDK